MKYILNPTLFNVVMDDVIKQCKEQVKTVILGYRNMEVVRITERDLSIWKKALEERNLRVNEEPKVMVTGGNEQNMSVRIIEKVLEQVEIFEHVVVNISGNGKGEVEITERKGNASKLYHLLVNTFIRKTKTIMENETTYLCSRLSPVLMHGCENWALSQKLKNKIQTVELKNLFA